ncbi:MAG TPA: hypothetical protein VFE17_11355 [Candidatus Baltobacteraceae bacterium]|nr:hypothetical protein [Candidatus Baltobacteraceae bacterium]
MRNNPHLVLGGLLLLAAAAACGGGSQSPTSNPSPTADPSPTGCTSIAPPALLYPAPSSTGQPDGNLDVWVGYPTNPSPEFSGPTLSANGQPTVTGPAWAPPSPGPTNPPGIAPLPSGDSPWISGIAALAPSTTYSVQVTNTTCNQTYTLGSFTTL